MIYFGKLKFKTKKLKFGVSFFMEEMPVFYRRSTKRRHTKIPHYFLVIYYGRGRCWIGANRFKRIVKNRIYELDGIRYYTKGGEKV